MTSERPDLDKVLGGLKDFQRRTVDAAFDRLWGPDDPTTRFLVADEVGLGKTLVARGVLARTVDHLWDRDDRIDIVYICSNGQIARQNLLRLHAGLHAEIPYADRLTMLPRALHQMGQQRVNIVSFTPGTSFQLGHSGGQAQERALLFVMLRELWGRQELRPKKWRRFFRVNASWDRMENEISWVDPKELSPELIGAFGQALAAERFGHQPLTDALKETADRFAYLREGRSVARSVAQRRLELIGRLRHILARVCVTHLDPDLVILDEFQRFSQLFGGQDEASLLVQELLGPIKVEDDWAERRARTLLLSATPFKMYTLPDEPEGDDHYEDFLRTVTFLAGRERASIVRQALSEMRLALVQGDRPGAGLAKEDAERELRRVMARTERLAATGDRDGMLTARSAVLQVTSGDVRDYLDQARVARALNSHEMLEYWRSSPFALELMERYHVKRRIEEKLEEGSGELDGLLRSRISPEDIARFDDIDPANPRVRWLVDDVLGTGAWQAAWLPPALPYYSPEGVFAEPAFRAFTKRLVFSAWAVAPKAIATSLSYEVERRLAQRSPTMKDRGYFATRRRGLLAFGVAEGRPVGMPALALVYPCVTLARVGDPRRVAAALGHTLPMNREVLVDHVRSEIEAMLAGLPSGDDDRVPDQRWYWAAPFLLDRAEGWGPGDLPFGSERGDESARGFGQHVDEARRIDASGLGPRPDDLADVLTHLAIAGPGACALRTLATTVADPTQLGAADLRRTASRWAWSLRSLFNSPEIMAVLEAEGEAYWREVLHHAMDGNLQAVLDEYAQVLLAAHSLGGEPREQQLDRLAVTFDEGSGLVASTQAMDFFRDGVRPADRRWIRTHFAVRYGRAAVADQSTEQRETQVREAFNSPFWPFVLASTSVGQEGLDFHHYSHAVVHWNLPSNPVDLEQREGRVHRFRGHAVRKNIARVHGSDPRVASGANPWPVLFELAAEERGERSEIFPDWVYPLEDGAAIERHVPLLPMSRGTQHYRRLLRTLGAYRMTLGQPRQSELIAYVGHDLDLALRLAP